MIDWEYTHIFPPNDLVLHELVGTNCPCGPRIEGKVVIHNAWDEREKDVEPQNRQTD